MKITLPPITPGLWGRDTDGFIRMDEQAHQLVSNMGTPEEWEPVCYLDKSGETEGVVALCHPMNAPAIAAVPALLKSVVEAFNDARDQVEYFEEYPEEDDTGVRAHNWRVTLDRHAAALTLAGCVIEP